MNLKEISLFLTEPIVLIPDDVSNQVRINLSDKSSSAEPSSKEALTDQESEENEIEELDIASYEGNFQKGLLILYQGAELSTESQTFLMNVLKAVNHSLKDIALISETALLNGHPDSISRLNPQNILIFGKLNHSIMQMKKENYAIVQDDHTCLFSDELREIEGNKLLKKSLWTALQVLFDIKS